MAEKGSDKSKQAKEKKEKIDSVKQKKIADKKAKAEKKKSVRSASELVRLRNHFYRDSYRRLITVLILMGALVGFLLMIIYYMYTHRPEPKYFATNLQGQIVPLQPLNQPSLSDAELLQWAQRAASFAFSFNYVQYRQQMQYAQDTYFTPEGGRDYIAAIQSADEINTVTVGKLVVTSRSVQAPTIINRGAALDGKYKGNYYWELTMPIKVNNQSTNINSSYGLNLKMRIVRNSVMVDENAKNLDGAKGIGIDSFLASTASLTASQMNA